MKKIIILISFLLFSTNVSANNFIETKLDWHNIKIIKHDLRDPRYIFKIGVNLDYNASSLESLMLKFNWISAVNWVFLCPADYPECWGENFTKNERYYKWYKIWSEESTWERVVFALNQENQPFLFQTDKINIRFENSIYYGFSNFPLLLKSGESKVWDYDLDYKMKSKGKRNFICSDKGGDYIYSGYIYDISLEDLPEVLKKLGCYDALNLDAWATSSMIYNGRQIIGPWRDLLDGIVIERKWLDTLDITKALDIIMPDFETKMNLKTLEKRVELTDIILAKIWNFRTETYEKNSIDLYDEDWEKIGYEIQMNELKDLQTMFILNYLEPKILKLNSEYNEKYWKDKNSKNWLF